MKVFYNTHTTYKAKDGEIVTIKANFERFEIYNEELRTSVAYVDFIIDDNVHTLKMYYFKAEYLQNELIVRNDFDTTHIEESWDAISAAIDNISKQFYFFIIGVNLKPKLVEINERKFYKFYGHFVPFIENNAIHTVKRTENMNFFSEDVCKSLDSLINSKIKTDDLAKPSITLKMRALTKEELELKQAEDKKKRANSFRPRM